MQLVELFNRKVKERILSELSFVLEQITSGSVKNYESYLELRTQYSTYEKFKSILDECLTEIYREG